MAYNIQWDQTGERLYELGVDHGVLYPTKATSQEAAAGKAFTGAVPWNGLTSVTESPSGADANDIYADNIKYASIRAAESFGGTIEAYMYPDEFALCNGEASPTGVSGVYLGQQKRHPFGFCYRSDIGNDTEPSVDVDTDYKLHLWWNCTASPSERQYQTINESPDAITMSWEISTSPIVVNTGSFRPTACMTIDTTKLSQQGKTNLATLLNILYGTPATGEGQSAVAAVPGYLPTPDKVIEIMSAT